MPSAKREAVQANFSSGLAAGSKLAAPKGAGLRGADRFRVQGNRPVGAKGVPLMRRLQIGPRVGERP